MTTGDLPEAASATKKVEERDSGHDSVSGTPDSDRVATPGEDAATSAPEESFFKLTIVTSPSESFDLTVNSAEMIQEVHQMLLERESTCHRTCFSLTFNGQVVDNFTEIRNVPGLVDGSTLNVVEEPYTVREVRVHIRHLREIVRTPDVVDASNALDLSSLTYLPTVNMQEAKNKDGKPFEGLPPEFALPGTKERSLAHLLPPPSNLPVAVRNIGISSWNPPPGPRKMRGDVAYIYADTVEKRRIHITCTTKGFHVNDSTDDTFSPTPSQSNKTVFHNLVDLLSAVSPAFKKAFPVLIKKRSEKHMMERLPTPYPVHSWVSCNREVFEDSIRAEDFTAPHKVGFEDHLPGQLRDWNEELQTTHEMPRTNLNERVVRDRSVFKIHGDFIGAALKGASNVVDGNVMAINPADDPKTHMFIWNNIFFSLGFDVRDHYKELGGDAAAFSAVNADLQGIKAYAALDIEKLHTLGMAVIDYRGYRITAQSIIPGILEREQEQSVVYGSIDFGKTVKSSDIYHKPLAEAAKALKIMPHEVLGENDERVKLFSSFETKGIVGNDGRHYVLDLLRTSPPDVNFIEEAELSDASKSLGFPRKFPHKLPCLRQELVEVFHDNLCLVFIRSINQYIREHLPKDKESQETCEQEITKLYLEITEGRPISTENEMVKVAVRQAAAVVNSMSDSTLDIRFNPDCYSTTVKHAPEEDLERQRLLVRQAAEFILVNQLPDLVKNCRDNSVSPIDGQELVDLMHAKGINVRYLGELAKLVQDTKLYLRSIVFLELIVRCLKHVLRPLLFPLPQEQLAVAITHLLNSIFGPAGQDNGTQPAEKTSKKATKKSKKSTGEWGAVSTKTLWKSVCEEAKNYYGFSLDIDGSDAAVEKYGIQKISLLRRLCRTVGIQLLNKDYALDISRAKLPFTEDDVYGLFPVAKHRHPSAHDAKALFQRGQQAVSLGALREAFELTSEAVNLTTAVYGTLHPELSRGLHMLARLAYIIGDSGEALSQQHKACLISERCNGLDHSHTIVEYIRLAHFAFANLYVTASLRLLYRARYLLLLAYGEKHPIMIQIDGNIGVILFAIQEFEAAIRFLQSAEAVAAANDEPRNLKFALLQHIAALCHASRGDFRAALSAEKDAYTAYNNLFGPEHEKTKESSEYLKLLTQHAVSFQKTMLDPSKASSLAHLLPLQIQQPSLTAILEVLNILNGIIFLSVAPESKDAVSNTPAVTEERPNMAEEALD